jgi:hypothetical protein
MIHVQDGRLYLELSRQPAKYMKQDYRISPARNRDPEAVNAQQHRMTSEDFGYPSD